MINWRLWLGIVLTGFMFFIAIFGSELAPFDKDHITSTGYYYNGEDDFGIRTAPFPPSAEHPLGTDQWGYDILSILLYGAKYTIFTGLSVAFFRVIAGGFLGILSGIHNKKTFRGNSLGLLGGIPAFLIIYFVMSGITINSSLPMMHLIILQSVLMTLIGIPGVYAAIFNKTNELKKNLYITASRSLGAGSLRISFKHILPHMKGTLIVMFVKEIILTLSLIGQLGIFNIFLGGTIMRMNPSIYLSVSNDWAGIIGQWRSFIYDYQWILLYPLLAFILLIFAFYILSRGLELREKAHLQKYPHI